MWTEETLKLTLMLVVDGSDLKKTERLWCKQKEGYRSETVVTEKDIYSPRRWGECEYYQFSSLVNSWFDNTKINKRNLRKRQSVLYGNENENSWVVRDTGKIECCSVCSSRCSRKRSTKNEMVAILTENDWQFYFLFWFQIVMKILNLCILKS